jgi:hypothetical protein
MPQIPPVLIIECGCCNCYHRVDFRGDCRDDKERFGDLQDAANMLNRPVKESWNDGGITSFDVVMPEYPESLVKDRTRVGQQATLVHQSTDGELFLTLDNGIVTLNRDGSWSWSER